MTRVLMLGMLGKKFSKEDPETMETICMKCQICCLQKIKKKYFKMLSTEFALKG